MQKKNNQLTQYDKQLAESQQNFLKMLDNVGLPSKNIFVSIPERVTVFANAQSLLDKMTETSKADAVYVSKFFAAVSAGLFDAALNYIWDETVLHLRKRIEAYDLEYFYEIAVSEEKRKDLKTIDDISKLTDDELLRGSLKIDLISEVGYRNIDLVKFMRNNASAAHPNQLDITGLKLISMAEDCLKEVISTPIPPAAIAVQQLLANIKTNPMTVGDAEGVAAHFCDMGPDRTQRLAKGLFGIFYNRDTVEPVRQNIRLLAPQLWPFIDENTRKHFGIRHAFFSANNHIAERNYAREFLTVVGGTSYIADQHRAVEVLAIVDELENAHNGINNFYNEVLPARRLLSIVGSPASVPAGAEGKYIGTLIKVFLSNGYGVARSADQIYLELINGLTPKQAVFAILLIFDESISSKLRISLCETKFYELVDLVGPKISTHAAKRLIEEIGSRKYNLGDVRAEKKLQKLGEIALSEIK